MTMNGRNLEWLAAINRERELAALAGQRITEAQAAQRLNARGVTEANMVPAPYKLTPAKRPTNAPAVPTGQPRTRVTGHSGTVRPAQPVRPVARGAAAAQQSLETLVDGLKDGSLDVANLGREGTVEAMMLRSSRVSAADVARLAGCETRGLSTRVESGAAPREVFYAAASLTVK
jgi:hypothetical protein